MRNYDPNTQTFKPYTINELVQEIYDQNYSHLDFMDNMGGEDCDCRIHTTLYTILEYWGE